MHIKILFLGLRAHTVVCAYSSSSGDLKWPRRFSSRSLQDVLEFRASCLRRRSTQRQPAAKELADVLSDVGSMRQKADVTRTLQAHEP